MVITGAFVAFIELTRVFFTLCSCELKGESVLRYLHCTLLSAAMLGSMINLDARIYYSSRRRPSQTGVDVRISPLQPAGRRHAILREDFAGRRDTRNHSGKLRVIEVNLARDTRRGL